MLTVNYAKPDAMNKNKAGAKLFMAGDSVVKSAYDLVWENAEEYVDKAVPKMLEDAMEVEEENE